MATAPHDNSKPRDWTAVEARRFVDENDDFGFEMRVAAVVRDVLGIPVAHGETYRDSITGKPRQFDFRFRLEENRAALYFAVECKNVSLNAPVLICGREAEARETFHDVIVSQCRSGHERSHTKRVRNSSVYARDTFVGKAILKPDKNGRSNDSEIYDRWAQAISSAHDLVREAATKPAAMDLCQYGAVFPWVVVPDGALWRAKYDGAGALLADPEPVDRCRFFVAHSLQLPPEEHHNPVCLSHIDFATLGGFRKFVGSLKRPALDWDDWIPEKVRQGYRGS